MDIDAILAAPVERELLSPAALRLARRLPAMAERLDPLLDDPLDRALAGLGPPPEESDLDRAVLAALAVTDGGGRVPEAAALEARAEGDPTWWVPAARVHLLSSQQRERRARMALAEQVLPYTLPGLLHPLQVEVLAGADRVVGALHVDWVRKLTALVGDALVLDLRALGLWLWPHLRFLDSRKLERSLGRAARRRLPPGGLGLAAAYLHRLGTAPDELLRDATPADRWLAALAIASDRPG